MLCTNIVLNVKTKTKNNFCTQHVLSLYFSGDPMNNLLSYCGLTDSRMRTSDTDLPVNRNFPNSNKFIIFDQYLSKRLLSYFTFTNRKKNTLLNKDVSILNGFRFRIIFWAHTFFANFLVSFFRIICLLQFFVPRIFCSILEWLTKWF